MTDGRVIKMTLSYDGSGYHGWQIQPEMRTIEGELTDAVSQIMGKETKVTGAGRTDAGAHARGQVASFKMMGREISNERIRKMLNSLLPDDIRIKKVESRGKSFSARNCASRKNYVYYIFNGETLSPFKTRYRYHFIKPLDEKVMDSGIKYLVGEHNFNSFRSASCSASNPVKKIHDARVERKNKLVTIDITGGGFLRRMVRVIAGTLIDVGTSILKPGDIKKILEKRDRSEAGPTVPARALFLEGVECS